MFLPKIALQSIIDNIAKIGWKGDFLEENCRNEYENCVETDSVSKQKQFIWRRDPQLQHYSHENIQQRILTIRGQQIIMDADLAE